MTLNDVLLKESVMLDASFFLEGARCWQDNGVPFEKFMEDYVLARWWIFCHQN